MAFTYRSGEQRLFGTHHAAGIIVLAALVLLLILNRAFATISVGVG